MKKLILLSSLLAVAALSLFAFRWDTDPNEILKKISEMRVAKVQEARDANKTADFVGINSEAASMAKEAVKGFDPNIVDPKQGYAWAQLFQLAGRTKEACDAAARFLTSKPEPPQKYQAQMMMLTCCNALGEGRMVQTLVGEIQPPDPQSAASFALSTARMYAATIQKSQGLEAALNALAQVEKQVDFEKLLAIYTANAEKAKAANPNAKPDPLLQLDTLRAAIGEARFDLYSEAGRTADALKAIDSALAAIRPDSTAARSLRATKIRKTLVGSAAPALAAERSYGEYKGLAALKGKVVIVDFFAHWCGPCIASFPDVKQMYADLHDKGLEIVGYTTYYGYFRGEGMPGKTMPRDTEFAKMGEFIKEFGLPWTVVLGERTGYDAYGVTGIPTGALIDRRGNVRDLHVGYSKNTFLKFRAEVEKLLAEK